MSHILAFALAFLLGEHAPVRIADLSGFQACMNELRRDRAWDELEDAPTPALRRYFTARERALLPRCRALAACGADDACDASPVMDYMRAPRRAR